jgi:GH25 family lysozyme M1 (1,4-beta-N-acetylmuramidase)
MWATFSDPNETTDNPSTGEFNEDTKEESVKKVFGYGVDISSYNGDIDLTPYDFVIIRINEGVKIDSMFEANVRKCEELNIPYGVY